jgi:hypothetical protein
MSDLQRVEVMMLVKDGTFIFWLVLSSTHRRMGLCMCGRSQSMHVCDACT